MPINLINTVAIADSNITQDKLASGVPSATNITAGTLPKARLPAGSILQVVTNTTTTTNVISQSTGSYAEISAIFRTSITPVSASSTLLLEWVGLIGGNFSGNISTMKFYDVTNTSEVGLSGMSSGSRGIGHGSFRQQDGDNNDRDNIILRATIPSSNTNSRTYSLFHYSENGQTKFFNATSTDNNGCSYVKWIFTITEIAG
jgi:hypothetical protein